MDFKEWESQRNTALETFRDFIKTLPEKNFTVQQLRMIGNEAKHEIDLLIEDIENRLKLSKDLTDLLK